MKKLFAIQLIVMLVFSSYMWGAVHDYDFFVNPSIERVTVEYQTFDPVTLEPIYYDAYGDVMTFSTPISDTIYGGDTIVLNVNFTDNKRIKIANEGFTINTNFFSGQEGDIPSDFWGFQETIFSVALLDGQDFTTNQFDFDFIMLEYFQSQNEYLFYSNFSLNGVEYEIPDPSDPFGDPIIVPPYYGDNASIGGVGLELVVPTSVDPVDLIWETVSIEPKEYLLSDISLWAMVESLDAPPAFEIIPEPTTLLLLLGSLPLIRKKIRKP